jgi:hypothetical protein
MLQTARQLAAGMGAPEKPKDAKEPDDSTFEVTGNAALGLWIGERFLGEIHMSTPELYLS